MPEKQSQDIIEGKKSKWKQNVTELMSFCMDGKIRKKEGWYS